ncbi:MAG TPA: ABC transporter ATP-binding protein [Candidatus Elarobacter sp.]
MPELLEVTGVCAGYGRIPVLHGVSLGVPSGGAVALIGANGAGKSTLLRVVMGELALTEGDVRFEGRSIARLTTSQRARLGIGYAPEGRALFPMMTVRENVEMGAYFATAARRAARAKWVFEVFPKLAPLQERLCALLSGGEQQMVTIARALMNEPKLLLLDEPSTGLAPRVVGELYAALAQLHADGLTVFVVEQNARAALRFAETAHVVENGRIERSGPAAQMLDERLLADAYLGKLPAAEAAAP